MKRNILLTLLTIILLFPMTASAGRLKGKLKTSTPTDYKVVVVNKDGSSRIATVSSKGSFSVIGKKGSSLHLVRTSGRYYGPIVSAKGKKAYASASGKSGSLGAVTLKTGFATVPFGKTKNVIQSKPSVSYDKSSGPLGAGKFGFVLSPASSKRGGKVGSRAEDDQIGEDLDDDGIPDLLDIDDDGDLKLDAVDPVEHAQADFNAEIASTLRLEIPNSLNVNIGSVTDDQVDALVRDNLFLLMLVQSNVSGETVSSVNVDCGSLSYCSSSGTATIQMDDPPITNGSLWTQYDPESDGQPNLYIRTGRMPEINLKPNATRGQIGTGDTILFNITTSAGEQVLPAVLPFVFVTSPALKEYTSGNSTTSVTYPVANDGLGTVSNPFVLTTQQVAMTLWKPQRNAVEGAESPGFIDMGGLHYGVYLSPQGSSSVLTCALSDYSNLSDTLQFLSAVNGAQAVVDQSDDSAVSSQNTVSFTLDIGACLTRNGVTPTGAKVMVDLVATSESQDQTSQSFYFQLP